MRAVDPSGLLRRVSPSQVKEFTRCNRKWWYNKVARIKTDQTFSQAEGESIHLQLQNYYEEGTLPVQPAALRMVQSGELPARDPSILVEQPRDYDLGITAAGIPMIGKVDLTVPMPKRVLIIDWKSAKSFRYNAKPETLSTDIQLNTYGWAALVKWPEAVDTEYWHGYVSTSDNKYKLVKTDPLPRSHVAGVYSGIESTVQEMKATAHYADAEKVPGNPEACSDYGGCPYKSICTIGGSIFKTTAPLDVTAATTLRARLQARRALLDKKTSSEV